MKYLIDFHHGITEAQIDAYLDQYGYTFLQEWDNFERVILVESDVEPVKTDIVEYVLNDETLEIRPHFEQEIDYNPYHLSKNVPHLPNIEISTTDEKDWWKNYVLADPNFETPTVNISRKGQNVTVYILDSGFNKNVPEFDDTDVSYLYTITENDYQDQAGHGTAIASIIAGSTCGITSAKLKIVKIFRPDRGTFQSEFLSALDTIISDCPENTFAVANCSWSIPKNLWIENKLREMILKGIVVVAAAGNNGTPIDDVTPASMKEVITVGSFNTDLMPSKFSDYTGGSLIAYNQDDVNHGELDGWAPGEKIWVNGIDNLYGYSAGTSMACAVTSAVIAYNLTDLVDSEGYRISGYENVGLLGNDNFTLMLAFARKNLIDLSDEKYANSKNIITTIRDLSFYNPVLSLDSSIVSSAGKGKIFVVKLFYPHEVKSAVLLDELPPNFWINPDGTLWNNATEEQAVNLVTGENFQKHIFRIKLIDHNNEEYVLNRTLFIVPSTFSKDDYPPDHEINVTLLVSCAFSFANSCLFRGTSPDCQDNCGGGFYICCGVSYGPKSDGCYCGGLF
jgi:hypothetical protein